VRVGSAARVWTEQGGGTREVCVVKVKVKVGQSVEMTSDFGYADHCERGRAKKGHTGSQREEKRELRCNYSL